MNYFAGSAGGVAGVSTGGVAGVVAGGVVFFSAQPVTAIAVTNSIIANSFFIALVS
jgi:hypothetical protein